jgi:hypothetical protein
MDKNQLMCQRYPSKNYSHILPLFCPKIGDQTITRLIIHGRIKAISPTYNLTYETMFNLKVGNDGLEIWYAHMAPYAFGANSSHDISR